VSVPLVLVLVTPLAGAVLAPAFGDVALHRRALATLCAAVGVGGAGWAFVRVVSGSAVSWRGFGLDPWRALLVLGAVLTTAAALARAEESDEPGLAQAAIFSACVAGILPLMVPNTYLLAVTLLVSTAGFAVATLAVSDVPARLLRGSRVIAALALSDALALGAFGVAIGKGGTLPPRLSTVMAAILLAAALIRLGAAPLAGPAADAGRSHPALGLLWLGPVRAQGFLLAVFAVDAHRSVAYAAAAAGVLAICVAGTATRRSDGPPLVGLGTGIALLGFSLGGAVPTLGAVLALPASFAGVIAFSAKGTWSAAARTTLAALPIGGLIAGTTLVLGAAFGASAIEPWFLALAIPAALGSLAACAAVWEGRDRAGALNVAVAFAAPIAIAGGLALAAIPDRATSWLAVPVARALGVGRLLSVGGENGFAAGLAVIVLGAAALAFLVGPGRLGSGGAPGRGPEIGDGISFGRVPLAWWAGAPHAPDPGSTLAAERAAVAARRWAIAAAIAFAVAVALAARVYIVAAGRGFL
jgi:hypothetical protein